MMPMSILIPHDGSPASGAIIEALGPLLLPGTPATLLFIDESLGHANEEVAVAERKLTDMGAAVSRRDVASTDPASTIVEIVDETRSGLVAMSTHGRTGQHARLRGGVAERVLRACPVPLFMANPFSKAHSRFSSVLVPLETNSESAEILDTLIPIAKAAGSRLTFLFVDFDDPTDTEAQRERRRAARAKNIEEWLDVPRKRAEDAGLEVAIRVAQGNPWSEIVERTKSGEYDLLAMTTHARSGVSRWAFGSVAERVLRACSIPILVQRMNKSG